MSEAVDFKKIGSKSYKAWRILSAPDAWAQIYLNREKLMRPYRAAIVFPEQLLGLNQSRIYQVICYKTGNNVTSHINTIRNFEPIDVNGNHLSSLTLILECEQEHQDGGEHRISVGSRINSNNSFYNHYYFSNQKDAVKYQQAQQAHYLSQSG
jgi:hypothetical protein